MRSYEQRRKSLYDYVSGKVSQGLGDVADYYLRYLLADEIDNYHEFDHLEVVQLFAEMYGRPLLSLVRGGVLTQWMLRDRYELYGVGPVDYLSSEELRKQLRVTHLLESRPDGYSGLKVRYELNLWPGEHRYYVPARYEGEEKDYLEAYHCCELLPAQKH